MSKPPKLCTEKNTLPLIHVVVVESHHHVLEHIHHVLRRKQARRSRQQQQGRRKQPKEQQQQSSIMEPWSMIHFDAHPDLSCPNPSIPAVACFQPRHEYLPLSSMSKTISSHTITPSAVAVAAAAAAAKVANSTTETNGITSTTDTADPSVRPEVKDLYEMLDSTTSGIAEWILPLVLAANLSEIRWIRPHAQNVPGQFPLGEREYHVGAWNDNNNNCQQDQEEYCCHKKTIMIESFWDLPPTAVVKCDWDCLYYRDEELDSSYAPRNELLLAQPLKLLVEEIDTTTATTTTKPTSHRPCTFPFTSKQQTRQQQQPWTLDICLDYFVCLNPFIVDIQALDPVFSKALTSLVFCEAKFYQESNREMLLEFRTCFINLLQSALADLQNITTTTTTTAASSSTKTTKKMLMAPLLAFYMDSSCAENLGSCLIEALWQSNDLEKQTKLVALAVEALPHLTMPHDEATTTFKKRRLNDGNDDDDQQSSSLSSSAPPPGERTQPLQQQETMLIAQMVQYIQEYQQQQQQQSTNDEESNDEPFLVTIARSSQDGFTPPCIVESLQDGVLEAVHDLYCNCGGKPKTPTAAAPAATRPPSSNSSCCIDGSHVTAALPTDANAPNGDLPSSSDNCNTNCRIQFLFDYGCWEGSTLDLL